ncbi:MAG: aspartate dehydrogenase [Pseudomonadota bacterium]
MKIGLIGRGAIAQYVTHALKARGMDVAAVLLRVSAAPQAPQDYTSVAGLPGDVTLMIDCAGHAALAQHGPALLASGRDMISLSLGALADPALEDALAKAAAEGQSRLHLASGAVGALDALSAAQAGGLDSVTYTGRKPPLGWRGSLAEKVLDLDALRTGEAVHFEGSARQAALTYPKNANVAAAVALAGLGFDATRVRLIADAGITRNIHEVTASGAFGDFRFEISGNALPGNPRSSALAAMSVLAKLDQLRARVTL